MQTRWTVTSILAGVLTLLAAVASRTAALGDVATTEVPGTPGAAAPCAVSGAPTIERPVPEAETGPTGYFRLDTDAQDTQFWLGAAYDLGPLSIASDVYLVGSFAEFDLGVTLTAGPVTITPMAGIGVDFKSTNMASLIAPQLFAVVSTGRIYAESWVQFFFNSPFVTDGENTFYTRNYVLVKPHDNVAVGPQAELSYRMGGGAMDGPGPGVKSLPVGGHVDLLYGKSTTLGVFLGYDVKAPDGSDGIAGRFTFIRSW